VLLGYIRPPDGAITQVNTASSHGCDSLEIIAIWSVGGAAVDDGCVHQAFACDRRSVSGPLWGVTYEILITRVPLSGRPRAGVGRGGGQVATGRKCRERNLWKL